MSSIPLHVHLLQRLADHVRERREQHLEHMGKGLKPDEYWMTVGRSKECLELLTEIERTLKQSDEDEGEGNEPERPRRHRR